MTQQSIIGSLAEDGEETGEVHLRPGAEWLRTVIDSLPEAVCLKDGQGRLLRVNQVYLDAFQLHESAVTGRTTEELAARASIYRDALRRAVATDQQAWLTRRPVSFELTLSAPGTETRILDVSKTPLFHADGSRKGLVVIGRDVTEKRDAAARLEHLAHHDSLTQLPNRRLFHDWLRTALAQAQRAGSMVALLLLDLDRFKEVNDTLGHPVGDLLLQAAAKRLGRCIRTSDMAARLGGDEFAIVLTSLANADGASTVAESIIRALSEPFELDGNEVIISCSVGITIFPSDSTEAEQLHKFADLALYRSKKDGRARYRFYLAEMDEEVRRRKSIERDLRRALASGELHLFYQPLINLEDGSINGAEALLRWQHPELGEIPPAVFIPIAEGTELIFRLGRYVLERACGQIRTWQEAGLPPRRVSVNLSPAQFRHVGLLDMIKEVLAGTGVDPHLLQFEITETAAMSNMSYSVGVLEELHALGASIAIDDFGTGYSSLNYLRHFPIDHLKIDRSFVSDLGKHPGSAAIIRAIISLGRGIGAKVNVEGVETAEQLQFMHSYGCDECQGFYFSRPLAPQDYVRLVGRPLPWGSLALP